MLRSGPVYCRTYTLIHLLEIRGQDWRFLPILPGWQYRRSLCVPAGNGRWDVAAITLILPVLQILI